MAACAGANAVLNFTEYKTDGYLGNSASDGYNQFLKYISDTVIAAMVQRLPAIYPSSGNIYLITAIVAQTRAAGDDQPSISHLLKRQARRCVPGLGTAVVRGGSKQSVPPYR